MKILVIGGSGLIGSRLIHILRERGHEAVPASPRTGVNSVTGAGLAAAMQGMETLVDVSNSPSFAEQEVMQFFEQSTRNLAAAAREAGVRHYVALSVVGADRMPDSPYMRAKVIQEQLIKESGIPCSILRATQFMEFLEGIAGSSVIDGQVHLPPAFIQPVAATDVAANLAKLAVETPLQGMIELGGPVALSMDEMIRNYFLLRNDPRIVVRDPAARYFGEKLEERTLVPDGPSLQGTISLQQWLASQSPEPVTN